MFYEVLVERHQLLSLVVYREVEIRVWEWLDVSVRRDGSVTPIGAFDLGHMKLSEGSPATTALTAALDAPPCDAVEPCVSSLPDAPVSQIAHHISLSSSYFPILMISLSRKFLRGIPEAVSSVPSMTVREHAASYRMGCVPAYCASHGDDNIEINAACAGAGRERLCQQQADNRAGAGGSIGNAAQPCRQRSCSQGSSF